MKRLLTVRFFVLFIIAAGIAPDADAQLFKNLFRKKQPPPRVQRRVAPAAAASTERNKPKPPPRLTHADQLQYPKTTKKDRYRIDVFASLYLDELVKGGKSTVRTTVPEKAVIGLNFYEGIKLAADSLDKMGYRLDVHVHDIVSPLTSPETQINSGNLDSTDLIIGAVGPAQVASIARFAKKKQINFVSVLSPMDGGIRDNFYFTLLQPTLQTHLLEIRRRIEKRYGNKRWIVYNRKSKSADAAAYDSLTDGKKDMVKEVVCNTRPSSDQLYLLFDSTEVNAVIMPVLDGAYADELLRQLARDFPAYRFEVWGMPSWKSLPLLRKPGALPNVTVELTAPFYFDATTGSGTSLARSYNKTFGGKPGEMTYRGFEVLLWYAGLLQRNGVVFNNAAGTGASAIFTRYKVLPKWDEEDKLLYNENAHLYLYRYQNGSYSVEN